MVSLLAFHEKKLIIGHSVLGVVSNSCVKKIATYMVELAADLLVVTLVLPCECV